MQNTVPRKKQMRKIAYFLLATIGLISCRQITDRKSTKDIGEIHIEWTENLTGDFSFKENWSYPEGVYINEFGQLSCEGLCPSETEGMQDKNGKIFDDSLDAFYKLIDTTHQYYSIMNEAWCYEWAGTNFITVEKTGYESYNCYTHNNAGTHSSLNLKILNDECSPTIEMKSINKSGLKTYNCNGGQIKIDKNLWKKGIMKAEFNFTFNHVENPSKPMFWKGKIFAKIENKQ
jgi:hypothetical protein